MTARVPGSREEKAETGGPCGGDFAAIRLSGTFRDTDLLLTRSWPLRRFCGGLAASPAARPRDWARCPSMQGSGDPLAARRMRIGGELKQAARSVPSLAARKGGFEPNTSLRTGGRR